MAATTNTYSPEGRERAVGVVLDNGGLRAPRWRSAKIGCTPQTLNDRVKKAELDSGRRAGIPTEMAEKMKALERENRELRQASESLRKASAYFAVVQFDPAFTPMVSFIDHHQGERGVERICDALPISPSTCCDPLARRADPARLSDRARRDRALRPDIRRVFEDGWSVCGARKLWHQVRREGGVTWPAARLPD
jgi:transposase-like protein